MLWTGLIARLHLGGAGYRSTMQWTYNRHLLVSLQINILTVSTALTDLIVEDLQRKALLLPALCPRKSLADGHHFQVLVDNQLYAHTQIHFRRAEGTGEKGRQEERFDVHEAEEQALRSLAVTLQSTRHGGGLAGPHSSSRRGSKIQTFFSISGIFQNQAACL